MSSLTLIENLQLEKDLGMAGGYVLTFNNRTFESFMRETVSVEIYDERYAYNGDSKANRMRAFWEKGSDRSVAIVLEELAKGWQHYAHSDASEPSKAYHEIIKKLKESAPVEDLYEIFSIHDCEKGLNLLAKECKDAIEKNEPQAGLDRLHTLLIKYLRGLCSELGASTNPKIPLHSLMGMYLKVSKESKLIESDITEKIIKTSISVLESFNNVRNNQSLAHDNEVLNYNESILVFNYIFSLIKFLESIKIKKEEAGTVDDNFDDIPF